MKFPESILLPPQSEKLKVTNVEFAGVKVRLSEPVDKINANRGLIYFHGGGWVFGSANSTEPWTSALAEELNMVVASVDYRLAPEHLYPAAFDDCVTATTHFIKHASDYGVDPTRIAVGGDSAGGNLAAAVALKLRDIDFQPPIKIQVPIYPVLQFFDLNTKSFIDNGHIPILTKELMPQYPLLYLRGNTKYTNDLGKNAHISDDMLKSKYAKRVSQSLLPEKYRKLDTDETPDRYVNQEAATELRPMLTDPYLSPMMADDLTNLPKTYLITAEYDVLRDDGLLYVANLRQAGNDVTHANYKSIHAFTYLLIPPFQLDSAVQCLKELCLFLKEQL